LCPAGFILGTLTLTYFSVADRISPPFLFCIMTLVGAALNAICIFSTNFALWVVVRTLVGFSLAGVYPVGMKIAAVEYPSGLGARLGVLVGALTLGTAFPWLVRGVGDSAGLSYQATIGAVSILAAAGAVNMALVMIPRQGGPGAVFFGRILACCLCEKKNPATTVDKKDTKDAVPDGESGNDVDESENGASSTAHDVDNEDVKDGQQNEAVNESDAGNDDDQQSSTSEKESDEQLTGLKALRALLADSGFRAAAIGYFGHMWELYAFWAWVPNLIESHAIQHNGAVLRSVAWTSFTTIAIGSVSSALAGVWSLHAGRNILPGSAVAAEVTLFTSLIGCLLAPIYQYMSQGVFLFYLLVWGFRR
jgi:hypothetical protein